MPSGFMMKGPCGRRLESALSPARRFQAHLPRRRSTGSAAAPRHLPEVSQDARLYDAPVRRLPTRPSSDGSRPEGSSVPRRPSGSLRSDPLQPVAAQRRASSLATRSPAPCPARPTGGGVRQVRGRRPLISRDLARADVRAACKASARAGSDQEPAPFFLVEAAHVQEDLGEDI